MTGAPWEDARVDAAFAELARSNPAPADLTSTTVAALGARRPALLAWRGLPTSMALAAMIVAVVGGVILGYGALRPAGPSGTSPLVVAGPSADLRTLDAGEFAFDFPADWHADVAGPAGSGGGSPIALLGTETVDPSCRVDQGVDMNCVYQHPLAPGAIRVMVGTNGLRGGTILDRPDIENGTTTRLVVGSMPAVLDTHDISLDSFYREDTSRRWSIATPGSLGRAVTIELLAREWPTAGTGTTAAAIDALSQILIDSFRFTPPPTPLPGDPAAATAAGRAALQSAAVSFRDGYVAAGDRRSTYLDCLGPEPEIVTDAQVGFGPGGDLGGLVDLQCYWSVAAASPAIWRIDATYRWTVGDAGSFYIETRWLDARGTEIGSTFSGDPPPAVGPVATETEPPASDGPTEPPGTPIPSDAPTLALPVIGVGDAIAVRDGGIDDREIAVGGWYQNYGPVPCPWDPSIVNVLQPRCPDDRVWLMRDPETLMVFLGTGGEVMRQPTGPALNPDLDQMDPGAWGLPSRAGDPQPAGLVMVGHFDDPLAATCPAETRQACRDRFVVDQVWAPDGGPMLDRAPDGASVMPEIAVSDAITVRTNGTDRHEIAVRGWYSDAPPTACPITLEVLRLPLEMSCPDQFMWLMQDAEQLHVVTGNTETTRPPAGPALNPDLDGIDRSWIPNRTGIGPMPLVDVVMVGHFDDPRAATCPKNDRQGCRDRFVVDQVWSGDRSELLATTTRP